MCVCFGRVQFQIFNYTKNYNVPRYGINMSTYQSSIKIGPRACAVAYCTYEAEVFLEAEDLKTDTSSNIDSLTHDATLL